MIPGGTEVKQPTQTHPTPSAKSIDNPLEKIIKFTYLQILQLQVVGFHCLTYEFFERIQIFTFLWSFIPQKTFFEA